eukprot:CAMPEP_0118718872 /NCGR_PEP_ID=MMETSP0800-20121206/29070_1 /TAXON_ID=210618 ORGANISM="Striatella unipunctata, Strain CCMP2910" /NCGR_SAMPLE_ID=MMETSP0800 /ASSEMBLY_ACC=CAM_ASM_000638 /LENGTH=32 /DNA_ID= /DNA_START= /DNA_END= /DNA_ORIENTATION=
MKKKFFFLQEFNESFEEPRNMEEVSHAQHLPP